MKHVLIKDTSLSGYQYGVLRAFEEAIIRITRAEVIELPKPEKTSLMKKLGHGMRLDSLRKAVPKKTLHIEADVLWCVLMGPETFSLDLFRGWENVKHRIVYLFDTYPSHFPLMRQLFSKNVFTLCITAFNEAKQELEKITGETWQVIPHAGAENLFKPVTLEQRVIAFSSYGRRMERFHHILLEFAKHHGLYYDYANHDGKHPIAEPEELYRQYAWHLNHSVFNISWPVEMANPGLADGLHPVTCRWFEAACAGTALIGKKPANPAFDYYLFNKPVIEINPEAGKTIIFSQLEKAWKDRIEHIGLAQEIQIQYFNEFTWDDRVRKIMEAIPHAF